MEALLVSFFRLAALVILFGGMVVYAWLLVRAFVRHEKPIRDMLETSPGHSLGMPFSAVAAFGIVVLLQVGDSGHSMDFEAFSLKFSGPAGPATIWGFCFSLFVFATRLLAAKTLAGPAAEPTPQHHGDRPA